jgi:hypothetical protein
VTAQPDPPRPPSWPRVLLFTALAMAGIALALHVLARWGGLKGS